MKPYKEQKRREWKKERNAQTLNTETYTQTLTSHNKLSVVCKTHYDIIRTSVYQHLSNENL